MSERQLNHAQQEAVSYVDGPLLIVAGAGTGKTTVITKKIAYLLEEKGVKPEEILALTFTDKAAEEMQERVDELVNVGYNHLEISTFHTFCQRMLEQYGIDIGISNQFKLLTDTDAWLLVREHIYNFPLDYYRPMGNPLRHIHELLKHFSKCKDELVSPKDYLAYAESLHLDTDAAEEMEKKRIKEIADAYQKYNQLLLDTGALDFGDLIFYVVQLLETRPNIRKKLQERYKYILVDEFQDVNYAQYELVKLLAGESQLTVVGDDDQSIYAFRGASVSNIMRFKDDFPNAREAVLTENYRSGTAILDASYALIQGNNPDRLEIKLNIDKRLRPGSVEQGTGAVIHLHSATLEDEVRSVVEEIMRLKEADPDMVWDDIAILARANGHVEPIMQALEQVGIPYEFLASSGLYRQNIVLDCFNFLKVVVDYQDSPSLYRLLRLPWLEMRESDIQKLTFMAKKKSVSYYEALKRAREFQLSDEGIALADKLVGLVHGGMKDARNEKPTTVLLHFLEGSGYLEFVTREEEKGNPDAVRSISHAKQFFEFIEKYQETVPGATVLGFVNYYQEVLMSGDDGELYQPTDTPDSVNILTVHRSKGLEFDYVFVLNCVEERFPTRPRGDAIELPKALMKEQMPQGDYHYQEERRLFYVAMTRAKKRLYFASADSYGGVRKKKLSRFLVELGYHPGASLFDTSEEKKIKLTSTAEKKAQSEAVLYDVPKAFSFSQIQSYATCPYQYKLAHILKIPTRGSAAFSFGQTMHNTLQAFYERIKVLNSAKQDSLFALPEPEDTSVQSNIKVPSFDELLDIYKQKWMDDWYHSKRQREDYQKKGREILKIFYTSQEGRWTVPLSLEQGFKIRVGDYQIRGRIDRIDQLEDGTLEIIDYKTGKSKVKLTGEDKEQLLIYQIATETLPEYRNIGKTSKLTFYYVNDNIETSFIGKDKELEKLQNKLVNVIDNIQKRNFIATPNKITCDYCDFKDICEYRAK